MDSTTIDLCLAMFDWARFRHAKGAVKLHLLLDHDGYLPSFAIISEGKVADVKMAWQFHFDPGTIVVDDRGYNNVVTIIMHYSAIGHLRESILSPV